MTNGLHVLATRRPRKKGKERRRRRGMERGGRTGNYFEFSTFEWQPRPIDYYRVEQTRVLDRSQSSVARTRLISIADINTRCAIIAGPILGKLGIATAALNRCL